MWHLLLSFAKGAVLILIWPIWSHFRKFCCEGIYLTSHGENRVKQRKKFVRNTITSARAQIIEICSEATFQPLLQLYLVLPKLMCSNQYNNLLEEDLSSFFSDVPKLQIWAILTSCLSLAWSFNAYQASTKTGALDFGSNLFGRLVLLASCICFIASRLFVFVLLAYTFGDGLFYPTVAIVISHMLVMTILHFTVHKLAKTENYILRTKFATCQNKTLRKVMQISYQCLLNGIGNIYLCSNILPLQRKDTKQKITPKRTNWKHIIVDLVHGLESCLILVMSYFLIDGLPVFILSGVAGLHILGFILKLVYYRFLHIWTSRV